MSEPAVSAPWIDRQREALLVRRGHAWLLHGPGGLGQYTLALGLARAWLCEQPSGRGACGQCSACHAITVRTHADLCVLMPETDMIDLGWPLGQKAQEELDDKKRKPSREIRIEAMREAIEFAQRTSASGHGKVVMVFPADRMNHVTANALLKTLEEPPGDVKFVLATGMAHRLLPTIRSRCQGHAMRWPSPQESLDWLQQRGLEPGTAAICLRASGGRPEEALAMAQRRQDPKAWSQLPKALQHGDAGLFLDWSPLETIDALHKLCHDLQLLAHGAPPRFFAPGELPQSVPFSALSDWGRELSAQRRTAEHPFQPGLMLEALASRAKNVLNSRH